MTEPEQNNRIRLEYMLEAAKQAASFIEGESRETLNTDIKLQFALVRAVEIIGEAASKITDDFQIAHPEIPWSAIISMRNRLIHAYFEINLNILWNTATESIPALIEQLEKLLAENSADET